MEENKTPSLSNYNSRGSLFEWKINASSIYIDMVLTMHKCTAGAGTEFNSLRLYRNYIARMCGYVFPYCVYIQLNPTYRAI